MERKWPLWTLLALGLHALPLALVRNLPVQRTAAAAPPAAEVHLEVELDQGLDREPAVGEALVQAAEAKPGPALARRGTSRRTVSRTPGPLPTELSAPDDPGAAAEPSPDEPLSLDALGIGDKNPFVGSDLARVAPAPTPEPPSAKERLERSLADAQLRADHSRGLGPAGPVLKTLVGETRNSETPANSSALFSCVADASGKLTSVELVESDTDPTPWRRVARRVLAKLASQLLRLPKTGEGAVFRIRVTSRQALPSGRDPGLEVTVLGIPVQRGDGERSSKLEILNPIPKLTVTPVILPSGQTVDLPTLSVGNILSLAGDPVDIGAPAQRVVHAHVESMTVAD